MRRLILVIICMLCISPCYAKSPNNFIEVGLGVSKLFSFNKDTNDALNDYSASPSVKLLTGSRLNRARTLWFELGYSHNGQMEYRDTKLSSQSFFTGLKLSTPPTTKASVFVRLGGGKTLSNLKVKGEENKTSDSLHYYFGAGLSLHLNPKQSLLLELQQIADKSTNEAINGLFFSFNQSFK